MSFWHESNWCENIRSTVLLENISNAFLFLTKYNEVTNLFIITIINLFGERPWPELALYSALHYSSFYVGKCPWLELALYSALCRKE